MSTGQLERAEENDSTGTVAAREPHPLHRKLLAALLLFVAAGLAWRWGSWVFSGKCVNHGYLHHRCILSSLLIADPVLACILVPGAFLLWRRSPLALLLGYMTVGMLLYRAAVVIEFQHIHEELLTLPYPEMIPRVGWPVCTCFTAFLLTGYLEGLWTKRAGADKTGKTHRLLTAIAWCVAMALFGCYFSNAFVANRSFELIHGDFSVAFLPAMLISFLFAVFASGALLTRDRSAMPVTLIHCGCVFMFSLLKFGHDVSIAGPRIEKVLRLQLAPTYRTECIYCLYWMGYALLLACAVWCARDWLHGWRVCGIKEAEK